VCDIAFLKIYIQRNEIFFEMMTAIENVIMIMIENMVSGKIFMQV